VPVHTDRTRVDDTPDAIVECGLQDVPRAGDVHVVVMSRGNVRFVLRRREVIHEVDVTAGVFDRLRIGDGALDDVPARRRYLAGVRLLGTVSLQCERSDAVAFVQALPRQARTDET